MPAREDEPADPKKVAELLYQALESLADADRKIVTQTLFAAGLLGTISGESPSDAVEAGPIPAFPSGWRLEALRGRVDIKGEAMRNLVLGAWRVSAREAGGELQVVPVRFPKEQYERFKAWCDENGFSMAVVIRGLLEQFLSEQGRKAS